jgi:hypothetical protein
VLPVWIDQELRNTTDLIHGRLRKAYKQQPGQKMVVAGAYTPKKSRRRKKTVNVDQPATFAMKPQGFAKPAALSL